MRYVLELDSPDFKVLQQLVETGIIRLTAQHHEERRRSGAGSQASVDAGSKERSALRAKHALEAAERSARPDRALAPVGARISSLQAGDEMRFVYGRPKPTAAARGLEPVLRARR